MQCFECQRTLITPKRIRQHEASSGANDDTALVRGRPRRGSGVDVKGRGNRQIPGSVVSVNTWFQKISAEVRNQHS
jgi:hypothetical protein